MITRTCQQCGIAYDTYPSQKPRYCSSRCVGDAKRKPKLTFTCEHCGTVFERYPSKPNSQYCTRSCKTKASNQTDANPSKHRDLTGSNNPMYGRRLFGPDNPRYGKRSAHYKGRRDRKDGYQRIVVPCDYPNPSETSASGLKYALEHRVVMEQHLSRYLLAAEVVHHIDGNPRNNLLSNLQLFANNAEHLRAHTGIAWHRHRHA